MRMLLVAAITVSAAFPVFAQTFLPSEEIPLSAIGADVERAYWICHRHRRLQPDNSMYDAEWKSCEAIETEWTRVAAERRAAQDKKNASDRAIIDGVVKGIKGP